MNSCFSKAGKIQEINAAIFKKQIKKLVNKKSVNII